jgi:magnesium transporter
MRHDYARQDGRLIEADRDPVWIDLVEPSIDEIRAVQTAFGIAVPTRAEAEEIELSARLYAEDDALFLTMTGLAHLDTETPIKTPISFILTDKTLITVRYSNPKPFAAYLLRAQRPRGMPHETGEQIMFGLIEALIDRTADALEKQGNEIDVISHEVFAKTSDKINKKTRNLERMITRIGHNAELLTMIQESLVSTSRLVAYYSALEDADTDTRETRHLLRLVQRDAAALNEHAKALNARLDFLQSATLGLINLEQNQIIKIFSIAAVVFLPPTLVASIYGMNFMHMPELEWLLGYPWALGLMVVSAILPFLYFKRKGWM